jgi:starch synthase (maltosyl-transferring)
MNHSKIIIENVTPQVDEGNHPVKVAVDEPLNVWVSISTDDTEIPLSVLVFLKIKGERSSNWEKIPMVSKDSKLWHARYLFDKTGSYKYTIEAGADKNICYSKEILVWVESSKIRYSTWYQRFPRSCSQTPGKHATLTEFKKELQRIADSGFDIVYIPPIHPIGVTGRKGKNGCLTAKETEPGCVWAVGNENGGHKAIEPMYGNFEDFAELINYSKTIGVEIAYDIAFS